jgi:hypothetical protein
MVELLGAAAAAPQVGMRGALSDGEFTAAKARLLG